VGKGTLVRCWWECKLVQPLQKTVRRLLKKPKNRATKSLLGIYPKENKSEYNTDTCTAMFIATLVKIAKLWNQPRCPSSYE
jgi:hypothetical protein